MQLTIDSTEPLDRVLSVVSSLYGVELAVVSEGPAPARATSAPRPRAASGSRGGRAARKTAAAPAARADTARKAAPAKRATGNGRSRRSPVADLAAVRSWARANGFQVSDRGRVSNAVLKAYEEGQRSSS
jgi:hypothetical protein